MQYVVINGMDSLPDCCADCDFFCIEDESGRTHRAFCAIDLQTAIPTTRRMDCPLSVIVVDQ